MKKEIPATTVNARDGAVATDELAPKVKATPSSFEATSGSGAARNDNFYSDVLKSLIGSFAGAGAAFMVNVVLQRRIEKRDNLAAGQLALLMIRSQLDDFSNYRRALRLALDLANTQLGQGAPEWMLAKPMAFNFSESSLFKFESLAFLLSTRTGRNAFEKLQFIERTYLDLTARHKDYNTTVQELQRTVAPLHAQNANLPLATLEGAIGMELIARVRDHQRAVVLRADRDEERYTSTFDLLNDAMAERYGDAARMTPFAIKSEYQIGNLPPLPPALQAFVNLIPNNAE